MFLLLMNLYEKKMHWFVSMVDELEMNLAWIETLEENEAQQLEEIWNIIERARTQITQINFWCEKSKIA